MERCRTTGGRIGRDLVLLPLSVVREGVGVRDGWTLVGAVVRGAACRSVVERVVVLRSLNPGVEELPAPLLLLLVVGATLRVSAD